MVTVTIPVLVSVVGGEGTGMGLLGSVGCFGTTNSLLFLLFRILQDPL